MDGCTVGNINASLFGEEGVAVCKKGPHYVKFIFFPTMITCVDINANAPVKYKSLSMACVHYGQPASMSIKYAKSMRRGCSSIFNLTKRGAFLDPTVWHMTPKGVCPLLE